MKPESCSPLVRSGASMRQICSPRPTYILGPKMNANSPHLPLTISKSAVPLHCFLCLLILAYLFLPACRPLPAAPHSPEIVPGRDGGPKIVASSCSSASSSECVCVSVSARMSARRQLHQHDGGGGALHCFWGPKLAAGGEPNWIAFRGRAEVRLGPARDDDSSAPRARLAPHCGRY